MLRRHLLALAAGMPILATGLALPGAALAQSDWPTRSIKLVVPYPPGGPVDNIARLLATGLSTELGQPVVVDNRAGAAGLVGVAAVTNGEPDGYTVGIGALGHFAVQPHVAKLPFKLEEVNYITLMTQSPHVFVINPAQGMADLKTVVEAARKAPGKLNFGSPGNGSSTHLDGELLQAEAKIDMQHIPYKGGAASLNALLAGEIQLLAVEVSAAMGLQGKLKIAAVMADKRLPQLPDVPTMQELGFPKVMASSMYGLIAPHRTPVAITEKLRLATIKVMNLAEVKNRLNSQGQAVVTGTSDDYKRLMASESAKWGTIIKSRNISFD